MRALSGKAAWMKRLALVCLFAAVTLAQEHKLAFEVATIKLNTSGDGRIMISGIGPGREVEIGCADRRR